MDTKGCLEISVADIKVGDRRRKEFGDLASLAESIKTHGLIHPPVVEALGDGTFLLLAGERRLRACKFTGMTVIPVVTRDQLSDQERREIELEENLNRENLTWIEEVTLKKEIDDLKRLKHGSGVQRVPGSEGWSMRKTAEALGESLGTVNQDIKLAKFLESNPDRLKEFKKLPKTVAFRRMIDIKRAKTVKATKKIAKAEEVFKLQDALSLTTAMKKDSVDLIITDPPYGVKSLDKSGGTTAHYANIQTEDNLDEGSVQELMKNLIPQLYRVLKPGRHIYIFTSFGLATWLSERLLSNGFKTQTNPIIWVKNRPVTAFTGFSYSRRYEMILFAYKNTDNPSDKRALTYPATDVIECPLVSLKDQKHVFEKPMKLLSQFIDASSKTNELVFDPFAGCGSTLKAALKLNREALGCDINETYYFNALEEIEGILKDEA